MKTILKNNIIVSCLICCFLIISTVILSSCEDELDITPKGKTTLETVADLEGLLNQDWALKKNPASDLLQICNEAEGYSLNVPAALSMKNSLYLAYLTYDETIDRVPLSIDDGRYQAAYKYINYMNVLISKMPSAVGDEKRKAQCIAEAHIMRAYLHWLIVNIHAKQYDESYADTEGGIAYVDNTDVSEQKNKLTLKETYDHILADCSDEYIAQLPEHEPNIERGDQAWGNAVRAKVLMQMKRYSEAIPYAEASLRLNGNIEDRSVIKTERKWNLLATSENNLLYIGQSSRVAPNLEALSKESAPLYEESDYVFNYSGVWNATRGLLYTGVNVLVFSSYSTYLNVYGLTSDRMYYTLAECLIRTGKIREGLEQVDLVRAKRIENFKPFAQDGLSEKEAMALFQRAKWIECIGTFENFFDCKRWNTENGYERTITRNLDNYGDYSIKPESPLWILPFPLNATRYNPSLTQNF